MKKTANAVRWISGVIILLCGISVLVWGGMRAGTGKQAGPEQKAEAQSETGTKDAQNEMKIHFLDVGQGLAILVQSDGRNLIYDGGGRESSGFVVAYLKEQGIRTIDYLISSHYDADHLSGLIGCLNAFEVKNVISSDYAYDTDTYTSFIKALAGRSLKPQHPDVGAVFSFGTGKFTVLSPETTEDHDSNNNSLAIRLENGNNSFIFTGDAESSSEAGMIHSGISLSCDILVPGHHGSGTASSYEFFRATLPEYVVISCGKDNAYGHPHKDTMDKLKDIGASVYRTDKQGTFTVISDGSSLTWSQKPCNDFTPGEEMDKGTEPASQTKPQADPVWISATGSKYHKQPDCGTMNPDKATQMTQSDAREQGYEACTKCYER